MSSYDLATRAQVLTLTQLGISNDEIEARTGVSSCNVGHIIKLAVERGFDPTQPGIINARHASGSAFLDGLPVELQLNIVSYLHLTSLIKMRTVSRYWRNLINPYEKNHMVIHTARQDLLKAYYYIIEQPWFLETREHTLSILRPFRDYRLSQNQRNHREMWLDTFASRDHTFPEDFEVWALEWPSAAAFARLWPGFPRDCDLSGELSFSKPAGQNMLSDREFRGYEIDYVIFEVPPDNTFIESISEGGHRFTDQGWESVLPQDVKPQLEDGTWHIEARAIQISNLGEFLPEEDDKQFFLPMKPEMLICEEGNPYHGWVIEADDAGWISLTKDGNLANGHVVCTGWVQFLSHMVDQTYFIYTNEQKRRNKLKQLKAQKKIETGSAEGSRGEMMEAELATTNLRRSQRLARRSSGGDG
ncbi:hypothetical protein SLS56_008438 [Neofusicoccum ribis]|uniref:F-box domain-containing protein n=1 Tax=Neofusicoccum ribis TaxID=45134 RepID=A0ABR3SK30_9PEZI